MNSYTIELNVNINDDTSQLLVSLWFQLIAHGRVFPHVIRDGDLPQLVALNNPVLFPARGLRCHRHQNRDMLDRGFHKIELEAVAKGGQRLRIGADVAAA